MNSKPQRKCYICGKPCWCKGCAEHLHKNKQSRLSKNAAWLKGRNR